MYIPFIYILFAAEAILVFFVLSIVLGIAVYRFMNRETTTEIASEDTPAINLGSSYSELLNIEIMKNQAQEKIASNSEHDISEQDTPDNTAHEKHSKLLKMRNMFLHVELDAATHADNDINFWKSIYDGMHNVYDHFKTVEHQTEIITESHVTHKKELTEKVFYIETQGHKIDGEVNRLKDIIFDQENTLSDMIKALKKAEVDHTGEIDKEVIAELHTQVSNFERQLRDSKTCMEVLELENTRLQEELHKLEATNTEKDEQKNDESATVDIQSMREMLKKQEEQIALLTSTIDDLMIDTEQAEKLKSTLRDFSHSSREMMSCITILEEENERLLASSEGSTETLDMKIQIKKLEEEVIKKDVAFARLQDEFSSMEKEYLAMYNAIHGDKG
jgi:hypothetical protein